ncbi:MAG: kinase/pyrophosphorylase [Alphaproteobacteria bacterium]|nr:kinase/pyrophosphorylase [Alphaproteobacteria bacterium]
MKAFHLHLVSDATGETLHSVARACLVQFEGVEPVEHVWSMIRTPGQMEKVVAAIEAHPGVVLYTLVNASFRQSLNDICRRLQLPCISVLDPVFIALGSYLGLQVRGQPGRQHVMDAEYFSRIDAMHFAIAHDDGQMLETIHQADVILVGVSRTSKTPTCQYLANRGVKAANVPLVPGANPPPELLALKNGPIVVGLTKDPGRLVQVRRNRVRMLSQDEETDYTDLELVKEEVASARRLFARQGWPVIDVTRRSIEETAASIMGLIQQNHERKE